MKRTEMPELRNGSKGGFEPGLSRLRVRHSTALQLAAAMHLHCSSWKEHPHTPKAKMSVLGIHGCAVCTIS